MDDIIIVGGGIGGLTLGLCRMRLVLPIFESAAEIRAVGVGINLLPHATRELAALGLEADLARVAIATRDATFFNRYGQFIYQDLSAGSAATTIRNSQSTAAICRWCCWTRFATSRCRPYRLRPRIASASNRTTAAQRLTSGRTRWRKADIPPRQARRDRLLRRHQLGHPQAVLPERRRAALFRRQHVARRHAMEADPVGRKRDRARRLAHEARW